MNRKIDNDEKVKAVKDAVKRALHYDCAPEHEPLIMDCYSPEYVSLIYEGKIKANVVMWMLEAGFGLNAIRAGDGNGMLQVTFKTPDTLLDVLNERLRE